MTSTVGQMHFPAEAKLGQVRGFLKAVSGLGGKTQVATVAREMHIDLVTLLPVMEAAEMLHLASIEKGEVRLLEAAKQFLALGYPDFSKVRHVMLEIEPFKTALSLGKFTAEQIANQLAKQGVRWHHEDALNVSVLREILIHWALPSKILNYDGYASTFTAN